MPTASTLNSDSDLVSTASSLITGSEPTPTDSPLFQDLFHQVFGALPRQGPGNRACAARALALCAGLPAHPEVLDLGCGLGAQTLHLAALTTGRILAIDRHAPFVDQLTATLAERGLSERVRARVGDLADLGLPPDCFDLVWSEGALYNLGIPWALAVCRPLLREGGYLAFTDAVWRVADPPAAAREVFAAEYPTMGRVEEVIALIGAAGFELMGHFTLSDEAWWEDFYTPMEHQVQALRERYRDYPAALAMLVEIGQEPDFHRRYGDCYAYEFFVARRSTNP